MRDLEAVQSHHLSAARARAKSILQDARAQAQQIAAKSAADDATLIERAEKEGEDAAELDTSREWSAARRRARSIVLAGRRAVYDDLRVAIAAAIRSDPRYPALLERLADAARRELGPGAVVVVDAGGDGGVSATRRRTHVDWSLQEIAGDAINRLGLKVEELWR